MESGKVITLNQDSESYSRTTKKSTQNSPSPAIHFFLSHVFLFPEQVPAAKSNGKCYITGSVTTNVFEEHNLQHNQDNWRVIHKSKGRWNVHFRQVNRNWELLCNHTWCCIRTHNLFISVKFWRTNSTASITFPPSLWIESQIKKNSKANSSHRCQCPCTLLAQFQLMLAM